MTEENKLNQIQIQPGLCPPEGCPPPDRIECIVVDKIYDSCFQIDDRTRDFRIALGAQVPRLVSAPVPIVGYSINCMLNGEITCTEINKVPVGGGFFTVTIRVAVPLRLSNPADPNQYVDENLFFTKTVTLCCQEGTRIDCSESVLLNCDCTVTSCIEGVLQVTCDIQVCLVIKCILSVQLLVPSYGFCVPAPCTTLPGVCPPLPPDQCF